MNTYQTLALIVGSIVVLSYFVDFKTLLGNINMEKFKISKDIQPVETEATLSLADIVEQWETLKESCVSLGLTDAATKLEEVFPLFVSKKVV